MRPLRHQGGWVALLLLLSSLGLAQACDDDNKDCALTRRAACPPSTVLNEKTCTCEWHPDAGADSAAP